MKFFKNIFVLTSFMSHFFTGLLRKIEKKKMRNNFSVVAHFKNISIVNFERFSFVELLIEMSTFGTNVTQN